MGKKRDKRKASMVIWLVFGPFLLGGVFLLVLGAWQVVQHLQSASWQEAPAVLLERGVQVERRPGSGTAAISGTSRLTGRYAYSWQGQHYESEQIAFSNPMTRTIGLSDDWQAKLDEALGEPGSALTVWVDPKQPGRAVLVRDLNWWALGIYVGVGWFLVFASGALLGGGMPVQAAPAAFSWGAVIRMWGIGSYLGVIAFLAWRDGHPIGAVLCALPLGLAIYGTIHGLTR